MVVDVVDRDPVDPCIDVRTRLERVEFFVDLDENILGEVTGGVFVAGHAPGEVEDFVCVLLVGAFERGRVGVFRTTGAMARGACVPP